MDALLQLAPCLLTGLALMVGPVTALALLTWRDRQRLAEVEARCLFLAEELLSMKASRNP